MITISVVIVNYNVKYFLARCIESVLASKTQYSLEIIVIDNASKDDSREYIPSQFGTKIKYNYNEDNLGFAKANNVGIGKARGTYVLILNPDIIIAEDTIEKCVTYLEANKEVGAAGTRMIDGGGKYLKESKRSIPSPWNSFCKFSGLSELFHGTKFFDGYNLGYLQEDKVSDVEVLCGAFILTRKSVLDKIGGFNEAYFMYGEDIELSNDIIKLGYKNKYYPETTIIHFKGESSKRSSIAYTKYFYNAMLIYLNNHGRGINGIISKLIIRLAIILLAILSFVRQNILGKWPLILDGVILHKSFDFLRKWWGQTIFNNPQYFNNSASTYNSIGAVLIWIITIWFMGHYDQRWKTSRLILGIFTGTVLILTIYSLLPSNLRSSRAMIIIGTIPLGLITYFTHIIRKWFSNKTKKNFSNNYVLIGKETSKDEIEKWIDKKIDLVIQRPIEKIIKVSENVIIDSTSFSNKEIISLIKEDLINKNVFISGGQNSFLLNSEKSQKQGQIVNAFSSANLAEGYYQRMKRLFDIFFTIYLLIKNLFKKQGPKVNEFITILTGQKTLVGYYKIDADNLPKIKRGIFTPQCLIYDSTIYPEIANTEMADKYYAMNYSIGLDYKIVCQNLKEDGNR